MRITGGAVVTVEDSRFEDNTLTYYSPHGYGRCISDDGAGIFVEDATLTVERTSFIGNVAVEPHCRGGAISTDQADVTVLDSSFEDNVSSSSTGVFVGSDASLVIEDTVFRGHEGGSVVAGASGSDIAIARSTFANNVTGYTVDGFDRLVMTNVTLVDNIVDGQGTITVQGTAVLRNLTVARNISDDSTPGADAGIVVDGGTVSMANSLIAGNTLSTGDPSDCAGTLTSLGGNLIGAADDCVGLGADDLSGTAASPLDPELGRLIPGLGPTPVVPLRPGSPAIDAGQDAECALDDQRRVLRPIDGDGDGLAQCDIGAVEQD